jgi:hypothetical protein
MSTGIRVSGINTIFFYPFCKYLWISNAIRTCGYKLVPESPVGTNSYPNPCPTDFLPAGTRIMDIHCFSSDVDASIFLHKLSNSPCTWLKNAWRVWYSISHKVQAMFWTPTYSQIQELLMSNFG